MRVFVQICFEDVPIVQMGFRLLAVVFMFCHNLADPDCLLPGHLQGDSGTNYQGLGLLLSSFDWSRDSLIPARYLAISFLDS